MGPTAIKTGKNALLIYQGQAVELAACECAARPWAGDSSMVVSEVGPRCRCGCVLHLAPTARLLAGSARACPARSFWLLQAEEGLVVRLRFEAVRLPCAGQALRARDGDSLGAPLLASWDGPDSSALIGDVETTTDGTGAVEIAGGRHILVELRSGDTSDRCAGGFLAHASQIEPIRNVSAAWASVSASAGAWMRAGGGARAAALALAAAAALAALGLALHSARRTQNYRRAADKESLTDSDVRAAALKMAAAVVLVALMLALHSARRTQNYRRAADKESLTDSDVRAAALKMAAAVVLVALRLALHSDCRTQNYRRAADKESLTDSDGKTTDCSVYWVLDPRVACTPVSASAGGSA
ncbi:hypothetical protein MSG28_009887 [Choristoneura fumiferana]|uniref:Uncharacterized protein n=1 Tax=Choristoneura fumiferana TaxID=7141 RepID=A0ACC0JD37_CHOFU|nr:hypothetical protein MSG28_009887 [Choristoneura fumiferana]